MVNTILQPKRAKEEGREINPNFGLNTDGEKSVELQKILSDIETGIDGVEKQTANAIAQRVEQIENGEVSAVAPEILTNAKKAIHPNADQQPKAQLQELLDALHGDVSDPEALLRSVLGASKKNLN